MTFEEPKVEFVPVEENDIITSSPSPSGPEIHICGGESYDDDCDPSKVGSL